MADNYEFREYEESGGVFDSESVPNFDSVQSFKDFVGKLNEHDIQNMNTVDWQNLYNGLDNLLVTNPSDIVEHYTQLLPQINQITTASGDPLYEEKNIPVIIEQYKNDASKLSDESLKNFLLVSCVGEFVKLYDNYRMDENTFNMTRQDALSSAEQFAEKTKDIDLLRLALQYNDEATQKEFASNISQHIYSRTPYTEQANNSPAEINISYSDDNTKGASGDGNITINPEFRDNLMSIAYHEGVHQHLQILQDYQYDAYFEDNMIPTDADFAWLCRCNGDYYINLDNSELMASLQIQQEKNECNLDARRAYRRQPVEKHAQISAVLFERKYRQITHQTSERGIVSFLKYMGSKPLQIDRYDDCDKLTFKSTNYTRKKMSILENIAPQLSSQIEKAENDGELYITLPKRGSFSAEISKFVKDIGADSYTGSEEYETKITTNESNDTRTNDEKEKSIKFMSNPMYSFYGLYRNCMQNPQAAQNAIRGFEDARLSRLTEIIPEKGTNARIKSDLIHQLIGKENISDYDGLKRLMSEHLTTQEVANFDEVLRPAFEAYLSFYNNNRESIDRNIEVMNSAQDIYAKDLKNLYSCFAIPDDKQCCCYLNPFPQDKIMDGISNPENVSMDYSLSKSEDTANYIDGADILKRKASTPFHETTHFLFFNSQFKKDIEKEENPEMKRLLDNVIKSFEKNGNQDNKPDRTQVKFFAVGAINEAFAACSSALYNEKTTGKAVANDNEWYHGWKQANDLTRQMYPLFKEYTESGRPFDNKFAAKLNQSIEIDNVRTQNDNATKSIMSEFIADVEKRHSQMSEYKSNVGTGIAYSEASSRYQNYVKDVISRQISTLTGISPDMAAKQFDTFLQDAAVTEYLSSSKSNTSQQFFALKKQIKNEPDKTKKTELSKQLNTLKENVYSQMPPNEKTELADKFIENQIVPKHANLKMKAEINAPEDGYCLKAITESLHQAVGKYGSPDFLPENTPENGIPKTFLSNLEQDREFSQCIFKNTPNQTFNDLVESNQIAPGAIVIISNGKGEPHHAMFWTGKRDEKGEPLLIGFNGMGKDEEKDVNASFTKDGNIRQMTVIDTNALLQKKIPDMLKNHNATKDNNKDLIHASFSNPKNQKAAEKIMENNRGKEPINLAMLKMKVLAGKNK